MTKSEVGSVIGADLTINGELSTEGSLSVYGKIDGSITAANVTVESGGLVKGDIFADRALIAGEVDGKISAKTVDLADTAKVLADIDHEFLSVQSGASLHGDVRRSNSSSQTSTSAPKRASFPTPSIDARRPLSKPAVPFDKSDATSVSPERRLSSSSDGPDA